MDTSTSLGQKIKNFRKRAGLSQLQLETELEASAGYISRVEVGKINPTKEMLDKVASTLNLGLFDIASLYGISTKDISALFDVTHKIYSSRTLEELIQNAVNEIASNLGLLGVAVMLRKENSLYANTFTQTWFTQVANKVIGFPFNTLHAQLEPKSPNLFVQTVLNQKTYLSHKLGDFASPFVNETVAGILQKVTTFKSGISFPINDASGTALGAVMYGKSYIDDFTTEHGILQKFTDHLGLAISRSR